MKVAPKEYWLDEIKCNSTVISVVWKDRFRYGKGWVGVFKAVDEAFGHENVENRGDSWIYNKPL